jgi:hypothetical protein
MRKILPKKDIYHLKEYEVMKGGYGGTLLRVDLEKKEILKESLDLKLDKSFIG